MPWRPQRRSFPTRAWEWLKRPGMCLIASQNLDGARLQDLDTFFQRAGFFRRHERADAHFATSDRAEYERLLVEDDALAVARLATGEKMYDLFNAAG